MITVIWLFLILLSWMSEGWYWVIAVTGYILYWRINYALNGGGGGFRETCKAYLADITFALPGGRSRRGEYIREHLKLMGENARGWIDGYSYDDIRSKDLYEEVGVKTLPGPFHFWGCILVWATWPFSVPLLILALIVLWIMHALLTLFLGKERAVALLEKAFNFLERTFVKKKAAS